MKYNIKKIVINRKILLFLITIIFFIAILILNSNYYKNLYISSEIIDYSSAEKIMESKSEYNEVINLYYNDNLVPYNIDENYYLFYQTNGREYEKIYSDSNFKINIINQKNEYTFSIIMYNDNYYKVADIVLTNIPVVSMNINSIENDRNYGSIYLYSPNTVFNVTDVLHYNCEFHIRGNSSQRYQKKSYKLNILSNKGKNVKISMLGMNSDSDWVLNPLSSDKSYIREKIGYDIWNSLSNDYNHKIEYVELIIDNTYQGIYCLQEVVDLDTFSANKDTDLLVSIKGWYSDIVNRDLFKDYDEYVETIDEFEFEKGLVNNYSLRVGLLRTFVNNKDNQLENDMNIEYDFENNAKYLLFINLISAIDNSYKNEKILFKDSRRSLYNTKNAMGFGYVYVQRCKWRST